MFLKHLWNKNFADIPCISLRTCWFAGNSVICMLFLDLARFAIEKQPDDRKKDYTKKLTVLIPLRSYWLWVEVLWNND